MSVWLLYAALAGFAAGVVTMLPPWRTARHAGPSGARLQITHALTLVSNAKGVYARSGRTEHPAKPETTSDHTGPV